MAKLLVIGVLALGLATPAVPKSVQAQIKRKAPALAYAPTRLPLGFHYRTWQGKPGSVRIWFRSKAGWEITFVVVPFTGNCRAGMEKSFQLDGNKVYWSHTAEEQQSWRCVGPNRRQVRLVAASPQPPTKFADVGLGLVVASGKRIA